MDINEVIDSDPPTLGWKLENGATVLDSSLERLNHGTVLCYWQGHSKPFVVWHLYRDIGKPWMTGDGDYYDDVDEAIKRYDDRRGANG